jgi:hypothetical protein
MRRAFYTRAKVTNSKLLWKLLLRYTFIKALYDAGCEKNNMDRLRICLLLSYYQAYPVANHEPESWLLEAQRILLQADLQYHFTKYCHGKLERRWRLLYASFVIKACVIIISARLRGPAMEVRATVPAVGMEDLEDISCTWFMDLPQKQRAAEIFLSYHAITKILLPLRQLLQRKNAAMLSPSSINCGRRKSVLIIDDLEEVESRLAEWRDTYHKLFEDTSWPETSTPGEVSNLVMQASVKMSYW